MLSETFVLWYILLCLQFFYSYFPYLMCLMKFSSILSKNTKFVLIFTTVINLVSLREMWWKDIILFFFLNAHLRTCLEWGRAREKKKERENHECEREISVGCLPYAPQLELKYTTTQVYKPFCSSVNSNHIKD